MSKYSVGLQEERLAASLERAKADIDDDDSTATAYASIDLIHQAAIGLIEAARNATYFHGEARWIGVQDAIELAFTDIDDADALPHIRRIFVAGAEACLVLEAMEAKHNEAVEKVEAMEVRARVRALIEAEEVEKAEAQAAVRARDKARP